MKISVWENGNVVDQITVSKLKAKDFDTKEMSFTSRNGHSIALKKFGESYQASFYFNGKLHHTKSTTRIANMKQYISSEIKR